MAIVDRHIEESGRAAAPHSGIRTDMCEAHPVGRGQKLIQQATAHQPFGGRQCSRHQHGIHIIGIASAAQPIFAVAPISGRPARLE